MEWRLLILDLLKVGLTAWQTIIKSASIIDLQFVTCDLTDKSMSLISKPTEL